MSIGDFRVSGQRAAFSGQVNQSKKQKVKSKNAVSLRDGF
jgi:hypothetical protein